MSFASFLCYDAELIVTSPWFSFFFYKLLLGNKFWFIKQHVLFSDSLKLLQKEYHFENEPLLLSLILEETNGRLVFKFRFLQFFHQCRKIGFHSIFRAYPWYESMHTIWFLNINQSIKYKFFYVPILMYLMTQSHGISHFIFATALTSFVKQLQLVDDFY